jgi:hypothetical protein
VHREPPRAGASGYTAGPGRLERALQGCQALIEIRVQITLLLAQAIVRVLQDLRAALQLTQLLFQLINALRKLQQTLVIGDPLHTAQACVQIIQPDLGGILI